MFFVTESDDVHLQKNISVIMTILSQDYLQGLVRGRSVVGWNDVNKIKGSWDYSVALCVLLY